MCYQYLAMITTWWIYFKKLVEIEILRWLFELPPKLTFRNLTERPNHFLSNNLDDFPNGSICKRCFSQNSVFWVGHFNSYTNFDLKHLAQKSTFQPISCWKDESSYQKVITLFHISEKSMGSLLANFPLHYCKKTVSYLEKRGKMLKIWFQKSKNLISKSLTNMVLDRKEQLKVS